MSCPGKPYRVALKEDMVEVAEVLKYYGGWADKTYGQVIDTSPAKLVCTIREPVGVCGQIIPWNYPLAMAAWKLGPALACGNTVVIKAAEQTPLSILYLGGLIRSAGFPAGVVNILNGHGKTAGAALASHLDVDKIAFTGSTSTAREIMKMASINLKNITLETGGKSPLLIFSDADLDQAVRWSHIGIMSNMGQMCTATSRILVQDGIYDEFISRFLEQIKKVSKMGDPFDESTFQGPQVTRAQYDKIQAYIGSGLSDGARINHHQQEQPAPNKGFFIPPTVFTNVTNHMSIYREEIFGPVVIICRFSDEASAIQQANDSTYGLGAAVFTRDLVRAHRVARKIHAGTVWINSSNDSDFRVPFGGMKQSGVGGRELGQVALEAYSVVKAVHVNMGTLL